MDRQVQPPSSEGSVFLPLTLLAEPRCVVYRVLRQSGREVENLPDSTGYIGWTGEMGIHRGLQNGDFLVENPL